MTRKDDRYARPEKIDWCAALVKKYGKQGAINLLVGAPAARWGRVPGDLPF